MGQYMPSRNDFENTAAYKVACDSLLKALLGYSKELEEKWWNGPNRAFDGNTPASQDIRKVYKYLAGMLSNY